MPCSSAMWQLCSFEIYGALHAFRTLTAIPDPGAALPPQLCTVVPYCLPNAHMCMSCLRGVLHELTFWHECGSERGNIQGSACVAHSCFQLCLLLAAAIEAHRQIGKRTKGNLKEQKERALPLYYLGVSSCLTRCMDFTCGSEVGVIACIVFAASRPCLPLGSTSSCRL